MATRIEKAFATSGDKTAIPENSTSTELSFDEGWSIAYELEVGVDAGARDIDRGQHNQLFNIITANIKEWQDQGSPAWQSTIAYPKWAITRYTDDEFYICIDPDVAGTLPADTDHFTPLSEFFDFGDAAYLNSGTGSGELPTNDDLGNSSVIDTATAAEITAGVEHKVVTADELSGSSYNPENRKYESPPQTLSLGGTVTVSHELGSEPFVQILAECKVATDGFIVGDRIVLGPVGNGSSGATRAASVLVNDSTISVFVNSTRSAWAYNNNQTLEYSEWDLIIKAWV